MSVNKQIDHVKIYILVYFKFVLICYGFHTEILGWNALGSASWSDVFPQPILGRGERGRAGQRGKMG